VAYFKIGVNDYSDICNALNVDTNVNYNAQTNAAGNTVVDYINEKRTIRVGIISLDDTQMQKLQSDIAAFSVSISFRDPRTNVLAENVACIIPSHNVDYYTIQADNVRYNAMSLSFIEL
jgi:hypothetical protein